MIASFRHKGLRQLHEHGDRSGLNPQHVDKIKKILSMLEAAEAPEDMAVASFRFHALVGGRKGYYSVTVCANWRITFRFDKGKVVEVNLEDYH